MGGHVVEVLKVSSKSNPNSVAGALAGVLRQTGAVEVQVVGAGALNQAIKAIAIARGFVAPSNLDLVCIPTFADILIDGQSRTAIRLAVEDRSRRKPEVATAAPGAAVVEGVDAVVAHLAADVMGGHLGAGDGPPANGMASDGAAPTPRPAHAPAPATVIPPPPPASTPAVTLTPGTGLAVDPETASITPSVTIPDRPTPTSSEPVLT
jgi:stage V sporulation protein S